MLLSQIYSLYVYVSLFSFQYNLHNITFVTIVVWIMVITLDLFSKVWVFRVKMGWWIETTSTEIVRHMDCETCSSKTVMIWLHPAYRGRTRLVCKHGIYLSSFLMQFHWSPLLYISKSFSCRGFLFLWVSSIRSTAKQLYITFVVMMVLKTVSLKG